MQVTFYGARGSIPTPGPDTVVYGGNTTCVLIEVDDEFIIIDMGSGARQLGLDLLPRGFGAGKGKATILFTHQHWDHIQGFPFFVPAYIKGNCFKLYGAASAFGDLEKTLHGQQHYPNFPVLLEEMPATLEFFKIEDKSHISAGCAPVYCEKFNHPQGVFAFKIICAGKTFVFATDVEHYAVPDPKLIKFAMNADVLVHDAQYTPIEYVSHLGWGHSTYEAAIEIAKLAKVERLYLTHHEPQHSDAFIDQYIELPAQVLFPRCEVIREGIKISV